MPTLLKQNKAKVLEREKQRLVDSLCRMRIIIPMDSDHWTLDVLRQGQQLPIAAQSRRSLPYPVKHRALATNHVSGIYCGRDWIIRISFGSEGPQSSK